MKKSVSFTITHTMLVFAVQEIIRDPKADYGRTRKIDVTKLKRSHVIKKIKEQVRDYGINHCSVMLGGFFGSPATSALTSAATILHTQYGGYKHPWNPGVPFHETESWKLAEIVITELFPEVKKEIVSNDENSFNG